MVSITGKWLCEYIGRIGIASDKFDLETSCLNELLNVVLLNADVLHLLV